MHTREVEIIARQFKAAPRGLVPVHQIAPVLERRRHPVERVAGKGRGADLRIIDPDQLAPTLIIQMLALVQPAAMPPHRAAVQLGLIAMIDDPTAMRADHHHRFRRLTGRQLGIVMQPLIGRLEHVLAFWALPIPAPARAIVIKVHDPARGRRQEMRLQRPRQSHIRVIHRKRGCAFGKHTATAHKGPDPLQRHPEGRGFRRILGPQALRHMIVVGQQHHALRARRELVRNRIANPEPHALEPLTAKGAVFTRPPQPLRQPRAIGDRRIELFFHPSIRVGLGHMDQLHRTWCAGDRMRRDR